MAGQNYEFYTIGNTTEISSFAQIIDKVHSFSDFTPRNNKCFVYPYNYLFVSNNIGNQNIYKYEDFSTEKANFKVDLTTTIGISGQLVPLNYKGQTEALDEIIPLGKYPTIAWASDSFTNWLTQQGVNIPTQIATSAIPSIKTTENGTSVDVPVVSTALTIASSIGQFYQASLLPNVTHGQNTADIGVLSEHNTFTFRGMRAKTEYLKAIDDYFTMYGYKVNSLKIPNLTNRANWNYIKTIGANILANIPQTDLAEIKQMFDDGLTLWHNANTFLDYSQANN